MLIEPIRALLKSAGIPYVIENVEGAPLVNPIMLCGTMFGLQTADGAQLRRHRLFEVSFPVRVVFGERLYCRHNKASAIGVYGGGQHPNRRRPATIGVYGSAGGSSRLDGLNQYGTEARKEAMGIDWTTGAELKEAIPPTYTEWVGWQLIKFVEGSRGERAWVWQ